MHKLFRGKEPLCLRRYRDSGAKWQDIEPGDKTAVRESLLAMQGHFCAYCEAKIKNAGDRHIEHFYKRKDYSEKIFDWANLFCSCCNSNSCGQHKDLKAVGRYSPADLIKPDEDDPEEYFLFLKTGHIKIKDGISPSMRHRAEETLRVFNLNGADSGLITRRCDAVKGDLVTLEALMEYDCPETRARIIEYMHQLLEGAKSKEFSTAIKHVLTLQGEAI